MVAKSIEELFKDIHIDFLNDKKLFERFVVKSVSTDTRAIEDGKKGVVFFALKGDNFDGHNFVKDALSKGVEAVVFNVQSIDTIPLSRGKNVLFIGVEDTYRALGLVARNYLRGFKRLKKFGLTGSSGKTTTRGLIQSVLSQKYSVVSSKKSYNNIVGVSKTAFEVEEGYDFYVQEMGTNHPGEIGFLSKIVEPDFGLITNIGPAHIGFFGSVESIAKEKKELLNCLPKNGIAFLNRDNEYFDFLSSGLKAKVEAFGLSAIDELKIKRLNIEKSLVNYKNIDIEIKLPGRHNVVNASAAIKVGLVFGLTHEEIAKGLESFVPAPGRGSIHRIGGFVIVDESYNANPISVEASINYLNDIDFAGRRYFVFGDMAELGEWSEYYHRKVAEWVANSRIDYFYTVGSETRYTNSELNKLGFKNTEHFDSLEHLSIALKEKVSEGDLVLIKGSRIMGLERLINLIEKI